MAGRLPPGFHYSLNGGNPLVGSTLHDLNTVDSRNGDGEGIDDADREDGTADSLNEDDSNSGSYGNSLQLQAVGVENNESLHLEGEEVPGSPYGMLTYEDVNPIETSRARFLKLIIENFIQPHIVPVSDSSESSYDGASCKERENKRKPIETQFEGDPKYLLPLTFVANLYETLVNEINVRLASIDGIHEKTMGVALEASGGLYRKLVKHYPKSGSPVTYRRREMASALEARTRFPQLVTGDEKRVRFVVVHGLELVERPPLSPEDAEWFKRLTGRHDAAISERDYKFYSPRIKHRRTPPHNIAPVQMIPHFQGAEPTNISHSPPQHQQEHHHVSHQSQQSLRIPHTLHGQHMQHAPHMPHALHMQHAPHTPPHVGREMHSPGLHSGIGMLVVTPASPAKFCDECGAPYLRETSKFCSECGTKRFGI